MAQLRLILGPAGSGKTWRVLGEVARAAAQGALPGPQSPPLLVIVPEQQALTIERAILKRLRDEHGLSASARVQVMSLTRLAAWLQDLAGAAQPQPSDLGRRLLVWSLLPDTPQRGAQAAVYAEALAELVQYGTGAAELRGRAANTEPRLAAKLCALAELQEQYAAACHERGLRFTPLAGSIPELLVDAHWPWLNATQVWVDGFAGFTPVEERALAAILARCHSVTATLLLAPRAATDAAHPLAREYAPTRELYQRWLELAATAGAGEVQQEELAELPRWEPGSPLSAIARDGLYGAPAPTAMPAVSGGDNRGALPAQAVVCKDERAEVEAAARLIRAVVRPPELGGRGWRYRDVSVITRRLAPYAAVVPLVFGEYGIPYFLDERRSLAHHPAVEYLRCAMRLSLGQAGAEDVYTLLKTDLLPGGALRRAQVDEVELYARESALHATDWLALRPWRWHRKLLRREPDEAAQDVQAQAVAAQLAQYDAWRNELLAPVAGLHAAPRESDGGPRTLREVLALAWRCLVTGEVAQTLEDWAVAAEAQGAAGAEAAAGHRGVLPKLAELFDELALLAGDAALPAAEICAWLEYGLGALDLGYAPPVLDSVLVTDIERGRQPALRSALLLGLSEDAWPPLAEQTPLFSDAQRYELNRDGRLLSGGAQERAGRELYLAHVAATRPRELLYLSRPAGDAEGRARQPSPYYTLLCRRLGLVEQWDSAGAPPATPGTPAALFRQAALYPRDTALAQAAEALAPAAPAEAAGLNWGRGQARQRNLLPPLPLAELAAALGTAPEQPVLRGSVTRLEAFAACPFKHFTRYLLRIDEPPERDLTPPELGGFYHRVLERTFGELLAASTDWAALTADALVAHGLGVLEALAPQLLEETGAQRAGFVVHRARLLLAHKLPAELKRLQAAGVAPQLTELRFGSGAASNLPPLRLALAGGELRLSGFIDRLDTSADGAAAVVDYKLTGQDIDWARVLAGKQLQLLTYLLAVDGQRLEPGAASPELRSISAVFSAIEPTWNGELSEFASNSLPPQAKTEKNRDKFAGLLPNALAEARRVLGELGARVLAGEITPLPLSDAGERWTACGECGYRSVCRFDPLAGGKYRPLLAETSAALRDRLAQGESFPGSAQARTAPGEIAPTPDSSTPVPEVLP